MVNITTFNIYKLAYRELACPLSMELLVSAASVEQQLELFASAAAARQQMVAKKFAATTMTTMPTIGRKKIAKSSGKKPTTKKPTTKKPTTKKQVTIDAMKSAADFYRVNNKQIYRFTRAIIVAHFSKPKGSTTNGPNTAAETKSNLGPHICGLIKKRVRIHPDWEMIPLEYFISRMIGLMIEKIKSGEPWSHSETFKSKHLFGLGQIRLWLWDPPVKK